MSEETFDIVNDPDTVIGQERRSAVHRKGLSHRGVHVRLLAPDGKVLIQHHTENSDTEPGKLAARYPSMSRRRQNCKGGLMRE